ncbi:hypothetical protein BX589_10723 [Paraburkholderia fungorum]|jgi:hypothetical protein|nr:hypothetical protein BX589_10723 [Paraburkholderia fungorum]
MNAAASQGGVLRAGRQRRRLAHANYYGVFTVSTPNQTNRQVRALLDVGIRALNPCCRTMRIKRIN